MKWFKHYNGVATTLYYKENNIVYAITINNNYNEISFHEISANEEGEFRINSYVNELEFKELMNSTEENKNCIHIIFSPYKRLK